MFRSKGIMQGALGGIEGRHIAVRNLSYVSENPIEYTSRTVKDPSMQ